MSFIIGKTYNTGAGIEYIVQVVNDAYILAENKRGGWSSVFSPEGHFICQMEHFIDMPEDLKQEMLRYAVFTQLSLKP